MGFLARKAITSADVERALPRLVAESDYRYGFPRVPWTDWMGPGANRNVSRTDALTVAAFWSGVRVLAEDIAKLPLIVYSGGRGTDRSRATDHPLWTMLHTRVNPELTSFAWRETAMLHLLLWGNHYAEIAYDRAGRPQLYPIRPERVQPYWDWQGRKAYDYLDPVKGKIPLEVTFPETGKARLLHLAAISLDGLVGLSAIGQARATIGGARASDDFGEKFYRNGARPGLYLTFPPGYPDKAKANFREAWNEAHTGAENFGKTAMLDDGIKAETVSMPLDDAQYIESRQFGVEEVARWLRIPPHKIGGLQRATFSNIEQQSQDYITDSLMSWTERFQATIELTFLADDPDTYVEFLFDALLKGDAFARSSALQIQLRNGALTPDEWRRIENRNSLPDGLGETAVQSADLAPLDEELAPVEPVPTNGLVPQPFRG